MSELKLTQADHGKQFEVRQGSAIVIALDENPTTGYRWAVDKCDDQLLRLRDSDNAPATGAGMGGGGTRTLTFEAKETGTVRLELKLWREWEGDSSVIKRFSVTLEIT